ncbi:MAG: 5'/3'-nucleotidase SurE [Fibrobacter sp.]|nr:5'/3'-nucleotidase SurE [Fibrobacter sp.]
MQNTRRTRVLIVNDDGFKSDNLRALAAALSKVADVFVFAPETEQSGVSQAFTVRSPLRVTRVSAPVSREVANHVSGDACNSAEPAYEVYSVLGTPADAAKFALGYFAGTAFANGANGARCADGENGSNGENCSNGAALDIHGGPTFDVCFSGVNVGENSGVSSLYSGTVAGAREGALWGVPSIALSVSLGGESLMPEVLDFAKRIVAERLFDSIPKGTFWNVNFPKATGGAFKGYRATKMALGMFTDHYDCKGAVAPVASNGEESVLDGLWQLDGEKLWEEQPADSDDYLLHQGYAVITPHRIDQTDVESLKKINEMLAGGREA